MVVRSKISGSLEMVESIERMQQEIFANSIGEPQLVKGAYWYDNITHYIEEITQEVGFVGTEFRRLGYGGYLCKALLSSVPRHGDTFNRRNVERDDG